MSNFKELLNELRLHEFNSGIKEFPEFVEAFKLAKAVAEKLEERDRKLLEALKEIASYGGSWETLVKNVFKDIGEEI